jgi:hypothetical protein
MFADLMTGRFDGFIMGREKIIYLHMYDLFHAGRR